MSCCGGCGGEDANKAKEEDSVEEEKLKQEKDSEAEQEQPQN